MMQPDEREVLDAIALTEGLALGSLWVEQGVVWHKDAAGSVQTICQVGTPFWCAHEAAALAAQVIRRASGAAK